MDMTQETLFEDGHTINYRTYGGAKEHLEKNGFVAEMEGHLGCRFASKEYYVIVFRTKEGSYDSVYYKKSQEKLNHNMINQLSTFTCTTEDVLNVLELLKRKSGRPLNWQEECKPFVYKNTQLALIRVLVNLDICSKRPHNNNEIYTWLDQNESPASVLEVVVDYLDPEIIKIDDSKIKHHVVNSFISKEEIKYTTRKRNIKTVGDRICEFLRSKNCTVSGDEIKDHMLKNGFTESESSVVFSLSDLKRKGFINNENRGFWRIKNVPVFNTAVIKTEKRTENTSNGLEDSLTMLNNCKIAIERLRENIAEKEQEILNTKRELKEKESMLEILNKVVEGERAKSELLKMNINLIN